jgi:hypothetical protein
MDEDGERQTLERRKTSCGKVTQNTKGQLEALRGRNIYARKLLVILFSLRDLILRQLS